mgnify:CR=1 FL=1
MSQGFFLDKARILERLGDDEEIFAALADLYLQDVEAYCGQLGAALAAADNAVLCREAHTVKGLLATFADVFSDTGASMDEGRKLAEERGGQTDATWHGANLNTASPEEMEAVLADTVLGEFKTRLGRIGLEYQTPLVPA